MNRPDRRPPAVPALIGVCVAAAALLAIGAAAFLPVPVSIDGRVTLVSAGETAGEIVRSGKTAAGRGDLRSVSGRVVKRGGGGLPRLLRDARVLPRLERIYPGYVLVSQRGTDFVESVATTREPIPVPTRYEGSGPLADIVERGRPGIALVTRGVSSGEVVSSMTVEPPVTTVMRRHGYPPNAKLVALTFDDGPWRGQTEKILAILKAKGVKATFFMLGLRVKVNPGLARQVVAEGHQVANHSWGHKYLTTNNAALARSELTRAQDLIIQTTGVTPTWYRPAGGYHTKAVDREAARLGLRVIRWTIDSGDYRKPPAGKMGRWVVRAARNQRRPVVLMHDGGGDRTQTIAALPYIIDRLKRYGYYFVTLDQMHAAP